MKLAFNIENGVEYEKVFRKLGQVIEKYSKENGLSNSVLVLTIEKIMYETELKSSNEVISIPQL